MLNMQTFEQNDDLISPGNSFRRNGSLICPNSSLSTLSMRSFSYNKLPPRPLNLTVIKLDGSSFEIEVPKTGTVGHLKQGVEKAFAHLPKKGPGTVSWPHVWSHFCLSYRGEKLLNHSYTIGFYGIQDGDQLKFVRHVSISYNMVKEKQQQEEDEENTTTTDLDNLIISDGGCKEGQENKVKDDDNCNERDIENQTENSYNNGETGQRVANKLANLFGRWFSYHKLSSSDIRIEEKGGSSTTLSQNSLES